ncbi:hypothetical protein [Caballeronia glebae]|uniref:hypothetical protein n=1 Tax=Caballeronia glebae TaxID=1777143 RepID=UPI0038BBD56E
MRGELAERRIVDALEARVIVQHYMNNVPPLTRKASFSWCLSCSGLETLSTVSVANLGDNLSLRPMFAIHPRSEKNAQVRASSSKGTTISVPFAGPPLAC